MPFISILRVILILEEVPLIFSIPASSAPYFRGNTVFRKMGDDEVKKRSTTTKPEDEGRPISDGTLEGMDPETG